MEDLSFIVDIQGFHGKYGEFLPKEVAVLGLDYNVIAHWIIKAPYPFSELEAGFSKANTYLSCYEHGLEWFDGTADLEDVYISLRDVARRSLQIYVWGSTNQKLLEKVLSRSVTNLQELNCPSFKNLPYTNIHSCFHHTCIKEFMVCALSFAYKLRNWLKNENEPVRRVKVTNSQDVVDFEKNRLSCIKNQTEQLVDGIKETEKFISSIEEKLKLTSNSEENSHGFNPSITSTPIRSSQNRGGLSRGQATVPVDETGCVCC